MSPQDSESARKRGCRVKTDVMLVIGAGQISMAIARRTGFDRKIVLGDKKMENAAAIAGLGRAIEDAVTNLEKE